MPGQTDPGRSTRSSLEGKEYEMPEEKPVAPVVDITEALKASIAAAQAQRDNGKKKQGKAKAAA